MAVLLGLLLTTGFTVAQTVTTAADPTRLRLGGGDLNRYETRYGRPAPRSLDDALDGPREWPSKRSIRTEGMIWKNRVVDDESNTRMVFEIHGERASLSLLPVEELYDVWEAHLPFWVGRRVEIVGAFDIASAPREAGRGGRYCFFVWEILLLPEEQERDAIPQTSLEELVLDPPAYAGLRVTVRGTFRGANIFGDMSAESQLGAADWVLNDGAFYVWVRGHEPAGSTFSLDPASRSDCRWRLEVVGTVESHGGYIYLSAERVHLLGRVQGDGSTSEP